jgi:hypothetical protein
MPESIVSGRNLNAGVSLNCVQTRVKGKGRQTDAGYFREEPGAQLGGGGRFFAGDRPRRRFTAHES